MRALTTQFADFCCTPREMRMRVSGVVALMLLTVLLGACGGGSSPATDPSVSGQRSLDSWRADLLTVEEHIAVAPEEAYWPYRAAEIQIALDQPGQAQASLEQALGLDADYSPALLLLSKLHYQTGRYELAVSLLDAALSRSTNDPDALRIALAINLEALGEIEAAQVLLAQCSQDPALRPGAETFLRLRGDEYLESRDIAETALGADPESASNHNNLGIALLYDGEPEAARESFLRAHELDPQIAGALYNLAIVETYYFYDREKGRAWFERYAELESDDPDELGAVFGVDLAAAMYGDTLVQDSVEGERDAH
jgi:tetratricopeptide (TPR) repeat protein